VEARRAEAAEALLGRLRELFPGRDLASGRDDTWDVLVNATPARDRVLVDPLPGATVVDLAYNGDGSPTALAAAAAERGCRVVDGLEVLLRQGAASFERWTGVPAPVEVMRAAIATS
jgi:shikimate 5-dehydrogenase